MASCTALASAAQLGAIACVEVVRATFAQATLVALALGIVAAAAAAGFTSKRGLSEREPPFDHTELEPSEPAQEDSCTDEISEAELLLVNWRGETGERDWRDGVRDGEFLLEARERELELSSGKGGRKAARRFARPSRVSASRIHAADVQDAQSDGKKPVVKSAAQRRQSVGATFEGMRKDFLDLNREELSYAFGPDAKVSEAKLSCELMGQFVNRWRRCGFQKQVLQLAFHGTSVRNYSSIFRKGFLLPGQGRGRVPIANGNAHGAGIYTAVRGGAQLSRGFCGSNSMLVCAVIDSRATAEEEGDQDREANVLAKIGRAPKSPSHFQRIGSNGLTIKRRGHTPPGQPLSWASRAAVGGKFLGSFEVHRRSSEILFVGQAMVVFNPSCVAPLFRVDKLPRSLYRGAPPPAARQATPAAAQQVSVKEYLDCSWLWPAEGNPNHTQRGQFQTSPCTAHELSVRRRLRTKLRQRDRLAARSLKYMACR